MFPSVTMAVEESLETEESITASQGPHNMNSGKEAHSRWQSR